MSIRIRVWYVWFILTLSLLYLFLYFFISLFILICCLVALSICLLIDLIRFLYLHTYDLCTYQSTYLCLNVLRIYFIFVFFLSIYFLPLSTYIYLYCCFLGPIVVNPKLSHGLILVLEYVNISFLLSLILSLYLSISLSLSLAYVLIN